MKIECKLVRTDGTKVQFDNDLGTVEYHFKPETSGGKHVCDVADEDHAAALLKITEAYAPADEDAEALAELVKPKEVLEELVVESTAPLALSQEQLEALKFPELKKMLSERYGKQLPASAKKEDYITALLNAQGV